MYSFTGEEEEEKDKNLVKYEDRRVGNEELQTAAILFIVISLCGYRYVT